MSDDDRRLGAYAPPPDDYETFDARDAEQDRRGWLFLAAAAVVFVLFVAVVYNTFQLGVRERSKSPVITADAEPYRVAPEEGDAAEADLGVHSLRSGDRGSSDTNPETGPDTGAAPARDVSEAPQDLPDARIETADADEFDADAGPETSPATGAPEDAAPAEPPAGSDRSIEDVIAARERDRADEPARQEPAPVQAAPDPEPESVSQAEPGVAQPYLAQIAAFRSREDAEADWRRFARAFPDLASERNADIQRADLGERGVYYRLRINGFETREAANAYCGTLQARGQACLVARR